MNNSILRFIFTILCLICLITSEASAAKKTKRKSAVVVSPVSPPTSLVVDMNTGKVLHSSNATALIYPASLAKLGTIYMVFEALEAGKLSMDDYIPVSKRAEAELPGKLGLRAGERIKVSDALDGLIVKSANDAAVALGEKIAGTEDRFVKLMTQRAHSLGMTNTVFCRASGWHHPEQHTTAIDLAKLAMALKRDFPDYYHLFSKTSFEFRGKTINGHNPVTRDYEGAEGMKTGFTCPSGFNLITTASRGGKSLVAVVTGSKTAAGRNQKMVTLLDQHFDVKALAEGKKLAKQSVQVAHNKATKKRIKSKGRSKRVQA